MLIFPMWGCRKIPIAVVVFVLLGTASFAQEVVVDEGYLDYFLLSDGRNIDVGALGGGLDNAPGTHKIYVPGQPAGPGLPVDGRLTGTVHGKFRVVNLTDRTGDGFINAQDLDHAFDVTWQLVGFNKTPPSKVADSRQNVRFQPGNGHVQPLVGLLREASNKDLGPGSAAFVMNPAVGPEGTAAPFGAGSVNFPPAPGGTASTWNVSICDVTGLNPNTGSIFCLPFAITSATPYTGYVDYTFPVSIPGVNDFTPGPQIDPDTNWVLAALVGNTSLGGGSVTFGRTAAYNPQLAVNEANLDLFGPSTLLNFPGEQANIPVANLLTTVEINVTPEPASVALLGLGALLFYRRKSVR